MSKTVATVAAALAISVACSGCFRAVSEGMGAAMGASGKVVSARMTPDLTAYRSLRIEPISVAPGLGVPAEMPRLIQVDLATAAAARGLAPEGEQAALVLSGQIIHFETAGTIDTAIGPIEEVVVRTSLRDPHTGSIVAQGNLVGRSKATSSGGARNLSGGLGKALDKWLKEGGLRKAGEKDRN
jgi:hypothetical protein